MQYMSSQEASAPNEIYTLGERYQLGAPEGAYYVTYTQDDIHRIRQLWSLIVIISGLWLFLSVFSVLNLFNERNIMQPFFNFPFFLSFIFIPIIFSTYIKQRWKNRPLIYAATRSQRVYLYQGGLIKQTAKRCEVMRWSDIYDVVYTPLLSPEAPLPLDMQSACIQISRIGGPIITLSGALSNIDDLAGRIRQAWSYATSSSQSM